MAGSEGILSAAPAIAGGGGGTGRLPRPRGTAVRRLLRFGLVAPAAAALGLFIIAPLAMLGVFSFFEETRPLAEPTLDNYAQLFGSPLYAGMLGRSVLMALAVTATTIAIGWPVGWAISRMTRRTQMILLTLVVIPYLTSFLLLIYAIYAILQPGGPLPLVLSGLGLAESGDTLLYTPWATYITLVYESLPIMILVMYTSSDRITNDQLDAARSLGAGKLAIVRTVIIPLSGVGVVTAATLVFIPVLGSFAESSILGGPNGQLFGNLINDAIKITNDHPLAAALSFVLLLTVLLMAGALYALGRSIVRTRRMVAA